MRFVSEVKELASAYNIDDSEVEYFLQFYHSLSDFIYCPPSKGERCIITNPQWLMDMFRQLLLPVWDRPWDYISQLNRPEGIISREYLHHIWGIHDFQLLIDLMIRYDFILPLDIHNETYLVPCMLPLQDSYFHGTEHIQSRLHPKW